MATSAGRRSFVGLAVALACFCFFFSDIADASAPALNSNSQQQQIGDDVLSRGFRRSLLQVQGPPPTPTPAPSPDANIPSSSFPTLSPSNVPTQSQAPPPTRPPGNFFTPTPAPAPTPTDSGAGTNPPSFDSYTPPPPTFDTLTPPPPADNNRSSSTKTTTRAVVGATVGIALVFLVALGAVVFFKPEWLPCCKEDRRRQAQYERHMTDF